MMNLFFVHTAEAATIGGLIADINRVIINPLIIFIFALALLMFLYGMVRFLANRDMGNADAMNGRRHMVWGIVGMFIMISVLGIMKFISNTLGVKGIDFKKNTPPTTVNTPPTTTLP